MVNNKKSKTQEQPHFIERPPLLNIMQTERTVIGYGITEDELEHVGNLNTQANTFFSVFAGILTFAFGLVVDWLMEGQPIHYGEMLAKVGAPICFILALVFLFLAIQAVRTRGSIVKRIKEQSKVIESH
jgi:hypothetical protein